MSSNGKFGRFIKSIPQKITINAPVTLGFAAVCVIVELVCMLLGEQFKTKFFCVYNSPLSDPLTYLRLFTHEVGHANWSHLINNMLYILLLGPILEEKHGKSNILIAILLTALATGIYTMLAGQAAYGASGVVFAFILMVSFTGIRKEHTVNLTTVLITILYIGQEVYMAITAPGDGVGHMAHIIGGVVGGIIGFLLENKKKNPYR